VNLFTLRVARDAACDRFSKVDAALTSSGAKLGMEARAEGAEMTPVAFAAFGLHAKFGRCS
jgi:hypothetical protein